MGNKSVEIIMCIVVMLIVLVIMHDLLSIDMDLDAEEWRMRIEAMVSGSEDDTGVSVPKTTRITIRNIDPLVISHYGDSQTFSYGNTCNVLLGDKMIPIGTEGQDTLVRVKQLRIPYTREYSGFDRSWASICPDGIVTVLPTRDVQKMREKSRTLIATEQQKEWYRERAQVRRMSNAQ